MYVYYSQAHLTCKNELRKIYTNQNQPRNLRTYIVRKAFFHRVWKLHPVARYAYLAVGNPFWVWSRGRTSIRFFKNVRWHLAFSGNAWEWSATSRKNVKVQRRQSSHFGCVERFRTKMSTPHLARLVRHEDQEIAVGLSEVVSQCSVWLYHLLRLFSNSWRTSRILANPCNPSESLQDHEKISNVV